MAKQAELRLKVTEEGIDEVDRKLTELEKKGKSVFAQLPKWLQKDLKETAQTLKQEFGAALIGATKSFGNAISAPAISSFDQVMQKANAFRNDMSRVAVATGRPFEEVAGRINAVSKKTGELPGNVAAWGRAVKGMTGDFDVAVKSMGAYKDRALQLDRPLMELTEQARLLAGAFGIKSTEQVNQFFGVMDTQAQKSGVSVGRLQRQWDSFAETFAHMSNTGASKFSGLTAAFAGSDANPDQAMRNQAFGMGTLSQGGRLVEMRMRRAGQLKKGEYLTNDRGEMDPDKYLKAMQFMQKDMLRFYGGNKMRAIEVQAGESLEARRDVGGFLSTDLSKARSLADLPPAQRKAFERWTGMAAGKREGYDTQKERKDNDVGAKMLGLQDAAVASGGGAAGLAMGQAAGLFSASVDKFGGIVGRLVSTYGPGAARGIAGAAVSGVGAAAGAASGIGAGAGMLAAKGLAAKGIGLLSGAAPWLAGSALAGYGAGTLLDRATGASDWISDKAARTFIPGYSEGRDQGGPSEVRLTPADHRAAAQAQAQALQGTVLKVQLVPVAAAPAGEGSPQ